VWLQLTPRHRRTAWLALAAFAMVSVPTRAQGHDATSAVPGWTSPTAFAEAQAAVAAETAGNPLGCIDHDRKSLALEEQPRTRLHLSACEARTGSLLEALGNVQRALEAGLSDHDAAVTRAARDRINELLERIPHVSFQRPPGVEDLRMTFDGHPVSVEALGRHFAINPGAHTVRAEGTEDGIPLRFEQTYSVVEGESLIIVLALTLQTAGYLTPGQITCMLTARNQDDVLRCVRQESRSLLVKMGLTMGGYADTTNVQVYSPELQATVSSPTQRWKVGGRFLVDVVSAASPDVVSHASPPFKERRYAGGVNGGYGMGAIAAEAGANYSSEPDYESLGAGLALSLDLLDKQITPRIAGAYSHDDVGRGPDNVIGTLDVVELEAGVTFVLSPASLLLVGGTAQLERGDESKPYRTVPLFDPIAVAPSIHPGAAIPLVNSTRLPYEPIERLPSARDRYALAARLAHRWRRATLRLDERLYEDSWELQASTTDLRLVLDVTPCLEFWPHARFHAQGAASFYKLAYTASLGPRGLLAIPLYRTTDRELSSLVSATGGAGARLQLSAPNAKTQVGLTLQVDVAYTKYFESLYITQRTALYGSIGLDVEY
jgi:hypothetical protein